MISFGKPVPTFPDRALMRPVVMSYPMWCYRIGIAHASRCKRVRRRSAGIKNVGVGVIKCECTGLLNGGLGKC